MGGVPTCKCNVDCENIFDISIHDKQQNVIIKNELNNPKFMKSSVKPEIKIIFPSKGICYFN
jgi:hypothetical protein